MKKYVGGINKNTYDMLFNSEDDNGVILFSELNDKEKVLNIIESITLQPNSHILINSMINPHIRYVSGIFKKDKLQKNNIIIKYKNLKYRFLLLDNIIHNTEIFANPRTMNRYRKCMTYSIGIAYGMKENCKILTGYVNLCDNKYLHSVIEYTKDNKSYILDGTRNIIMEKNDYFELTNFKVISEVDNFDMKNDIDVIYGLNFDTKPYLVFRDEIMKDINKIKTLK